jgi:hypothetical protein
MIKLTLMVGKPLFKKIIKQVGKGRKDIRGYRKKQAETSTKELKTLNTAQERLETAKNVRDVSQKVLKMRKFPKEARDSFGKAFEGVVKKRSQTRNILMDPKYLKPKKNKIGGIIKAKKGLFI